LLRNRLSTEHVNFVKKGGVEGEVPVWGECTGKKFFPAFTSEGEKTELGPKKEKGVASIKSVLDTLRDMSSSGANA